MHEFKCKQCESVFLNKRKVATFCSHKCANIFSIPTRAVKKGTYKDCLVCGNAFYYPASSIKYRTPKYCSRKCSGLGTQNREVFQCSFCKKDIPVMQSRAEKHNNHFCNILCHHKYMHEKPNRVVNGFWYENGYKVISVKSKKQGKKEHIKVMEEHIGRSITKNEVVHHINEVKDDNRIDNLQLMTRSEHARLHRLQDIANGKKLFCV